MANTFITNKLTDYVALRLGENLGYLTVGSRKYFTNQLEGKRNGQTYDFILRGATEAVNRLEIDPTTDNLDIVEKKISLTLDPWHVAVRSSSLDPICETDWDKAVAIPQGAKLANGIVRSQIKKDLGSCATAFVGSGFVPLAKASAHLQSISNEKIYGFLHGSAQAVLTSNGQSFQPVGALDSFYKNGLLGTFQNCEYRAQRFMPQVIVPADLVTACDSATVTSYTPGTDYDTVVLSLGSYSGKVPAGFVFHMANVWAADLIGDPTANLYAFIITEDATATSGTVSVKVKPVIFEGGAKSIVKDDGTEWTAAELANAVVSTPCEAGTYFSAVLRLDGAYEAEWLDHLDASNSETKYGHVNGITTIENRVFDPMKMTNLTRWDVVKLAGVVEPRGCAFVLVK